MLHPIGPRYTFFFQIDIHGRCRTGKVMKYDPVTGHRIKDEAVGGRITWVHSLMKRSGALKADWELTQCLFGEHLLTKCPGRTVALVESEKTAVICSALMPEYVWLATVGKSQLGDKLNVLQQRTIIAFPDVDGYELWKQKASELTSLRITVSDYLETTATPEERDAHIDIADRLIAQIRDGSLVPPADCPIWWDKGQRDTKQRKSYEYADTADRQDVPQLSSASTELERHRVCFPFRRLCRIQGQYAELQRHLKLIICASAPQSNGISRAYSKAAEIGEPETPSTTAVDIKDDYEAKYGAVSAGNPKVFFKYFFVNTATGEKSCEMLASVMLASSNGENVPEENQNPGGNEQGGGSGTNPGGGSNY